MTGLFTKAYYMNMSCKTTSNCKIPIHCKLDEDSSWINVHWIVKIKIAQTWPNRVSNY